MLLTAVSGLVLLAANGVKDGAENITKTTESTTAGLIQPGGSLPNASGDLLQVLLALIFVVAAIFACAWLIRRLQNVGGFSNSHMKVLAALPLGTKDRILLVDACGQQLLLGVSSGGINTLHVFAEPVFVDGELSTPDFAHKMRQVLSSLSKGKAEPSPEPLHSHNNDTK